MTEKANVWRGRGWVRGAGGAQGGAAPTGAAPGQLDLRQGPRQQQQRQEQQGRGSRNWEGWRDDAPQVDREEEKAPQEQHRQLQGRGGRQGGYYNHQRGGGGGSSGGLYRASGRDNRQSGSAPGGGVLLDASSHPGSTAHALRVISWNTDGLHHAAAPRAYAAAADMLALSPTVIALQEVTAESWPVFCDVLGAAGYTVNDGGLTDARKKACGYWCVLAYLRSAIDATHIGSVPFEGTKMGRAVLGMRTNKGVFLTSHLESMGKEGSAERQRQMHTVLAMMAEGPDDVFFLADTNLRDHECPPAVLSSRNVSDTWVATGSDEATRYTWDMDINDNLPNMKGARLRFDRVWHRPATASGLRATRFALGGQRRIEGGAAAGMFASDHWMVCVDYV